MQPVSEKYKAGVNHYSRSIRTFAYFNDAVEPLHSELTKVSVNEIGTNDKALTLGAVFTNKADVSFRMPGDSVIPLHGGKVRLEHGIIVDSEYEKVKMGTFFINEIKKTEGTNLVSFTGYDGTIKLEKDYKPTISFPARLADVVNDILTQCGLTLCGSIDEDITIESYYETTCKVMLGYMAGLLGKNVKANRDGEIEFYSWEPCDYTITRSVQYMGGLKKTDEQDVVIGSLTSGTEENTLTVGSGYGITFTNPYMTQERLEAIFALWEGLTYTPCTVKYRGNPALEPGDMPLVEDRDGTLRRIILSEHKLILTGLKGDISSESKTSENLVVTKSPTDKKLEQFKLSMQKVMTDITEKIVGIKGGYYSIDYDEDGFPCGWTIMNTPSLTLDTKLWKMSMGGFGFSADGGRTFSNLAFDMDGQFFANAINAGVLNGECFSLNLDTGEVLIGLRDAEGNISEPAFSFSPAGGLRIEVEGSEEISISPTPPEDTKQMWLDTSTEPNILKYYDSTDWVMVNDQTEEYKSLLETTEKEIRLEVSKKVGSDEIISSINQSAEEIKILASKIKFEGLVTANDNFKILTDGSIETIKGKIGDITINSDGIMSTDGEGEIKLWNDGRIVSTRIYDDTDYPISEYSYLYEGTVGLAYEPTNAPQGSSKLLLTSRGIYHYEKSINDGYEEFLNTCNSIYFKNYELHGYNGILVTTDELEVSGHLEVNGGIDASSTYNTLGRFKLQNGWLGFYPTFEDAKDNTNRYGFILHDGTDLTYTNLTGGTHVFNTSVSVSGFLASNNFSKDMQVKRLVYGTNTTQVISTGSSRFIAKVYIALNGGIYIDDTVYGNKGSISVQRNGTNTNQTAYSYDSYQLTITCYTNWSYGFVISSFG